ncbi:MAG TPA: aminotransferase class V-fold PLP-dependent enzyme [Gaiellaceae bacterium]|jgi:L-cysteine/cystine lyase
MTSEEARAQFPVLERVAYLNAGSMGPLPRTTFEAMSAGLRRDLDEGRGGKPYYELILDLRLRARTRLAEVVGADPEQMALTSSTTDGCNIVLAGLELGPEDEIVTSASEHPGLLAPLHVSGARVVVAPTLGRPASEALDAILGAVTERTRLLALSHVAWTTGQVFPVDELKERTGLPVLVDGAQSVGAIPVDVGALDFYTVSCQKWLCGPEPLGALYIAEPERLRVGRPTGFSQESIEPDGAFVPRQGAARFDSGWLAASSLAGLLASLDCAPEWRFDGAARMAARCREALVAAGLDVVTEADQATLVSFVPREEADAAARRAYESGVVIRDLPGTGWVRASCGWWTDEVDIDRLLSALR